MCPFFILTLIFSALMFLVRVGAAFVITFDPHEVLKLTEDDLFYVNFSAKISEPPQKLRVISDRPDIANGDINLEKWDSSGTELNGTLIVRGRFLGHARLKVATNTSKSDDSLHVSVVRKHSKIQVAFIACVAVMVSLNYINMGCAIDLEVIKSCLKRPIGPGVGFVSQYLLMPLLSYGLAKWLFSEPYLQLGLFTFGCSPGGGASNMWTVLLKGNLNLSITMTFLSTIAAIGMMPLWLFTLGHSLFERTAVIVPFRNLLTTLLSMTLPLAVGVLLQRRVPRVAQFCRRILAPVSICMILFIIAFGTYANLYMFRMFTWRVLIAASANVWLGFLLGFVASLLSGLSKEDAISIMVETGVQNTGIAIVLLGFSLPQPDADMAAVVPVAASITMPIPLLFIMCVMRIRDCVARKSETAAFKGLDDAQGDAASFLSTASTVTVESPVYGEKEIFYSTQNI